MGLIVDGVLVAFLLLQSFLGWRRGFLWQAAGVASLAFGLLLGFFIAPIVSPVLAEYVTSNDLHARLVAFLFVVTVVGLALRMAAGWAEIRTDNGAPKKVREQRRADDRVLGGIFGALKGSVMVLVLMAAAVSLWPRSGFWERSSLAAPMAEAGSRLLPGGAVQEATEWALTEIRLAKAKLQK